MGQGRLHGHAARERAVAEAADEGRDERPDGVAEPFLLAFAHLGQGFVLGQVFEPAGFNIGINASRIAGAGIADHPSQQAPVEVGAILFLVVLQVRPPAAARAAAGPTAVQGLCPPDRHQGNPRPDPSPRTRPGRHRESTASEIMESAMAKHDSSLIPVRQNS